MIETEVLETLEIGSVIELPPLFPGMTSENVLFTVTRIITDKTTLKPKVLEGDVSCFGLLMGSATCALNDKEAPEWEFT